MGHESYDRQEQIQSGSNRSFGFIFAIFFAVIGLLPIFFGGSARGWALAVAGIFLLSAVAFPAVLAPLNRSWHKLGLMLHRIVSPVVLGIMFFLVITPIGVVMRILGKDLLRLRLDTQSQSYWIERDPPGPSPESLKDQF